MDEESHLNILISMGYPSDSAAWALSQSNDNLEMAIEILSNKGEFFVLV